MRNSRDDVGIWHETFLVRAGEDEAIYTAYANTLEGAVALLTLVAIRLIEVDVS